MNYVERNFLFYILTRAHDTGRKTLSLQVVVKELDMYAKVALNHTDGRHWDLAELTLPLGSFRLEYRAVGHSKDTLQITNITVQPGTCGRSINSIYSMFSIMLNKMCIQSITPKLIT